LLVFYNIPIYERNIYSLKNQLIESVKTSLADKEPTRCISATGAHGLVVAHNDAFFRHILSSFYLNIPDGMPLVWWGKLKGYSEIGRCYGPDLFSIIMQATAKTSVSHFLCGGLPGVADKLRKAVDINWGNKNVSGTYCPPFSSLKEEDWCSLATAISLSGAQIVWVGLSTPKQEKFAWELSKRIKVHYIITVGAAFDFHSGSLKQAPRWIQNSGLEWFYRFCKEPRRLWKRYSEVVPKFAYLMIADLVKHFMRRMVSFYK
jgi:N-acetylglucosaminyldiphosphoundecaprenol N-acetyl-beta-D-mannosaminyltransferase